MKSAATDSSHRSLERPTACETYSVREAATRLGISAHVIYQRINAGVIPVVGLDVRRKLIPKHVVDRLLLKTDPGTSDASDGTQTEDSETEKS